MILDYYNSASEHHFYYLMFCFPNCGDVYFVAIVFRQFLIVSHTESYREESDILRSTFETRFKDIRETAKYHMQSSRREVWKCDAAKDNGKIHYLINQEH